MLIVSSDSEPGFERIFLTSLSFEPDPNILSTTQDRVVDDPDDPETVQGGVQDSWLKST